MTWWQRRFAEVLLLLFGIIGILQLLEVRL